MSEKLSFSKQYTLYKYVYEIDDIYIISVRVCKLLGGGCIHVYIGTELFAVLSLVLDPDDFIYCKYHLGRFFMQSVGPAPVKFSLSFPSCKR